MNKEQKLKDAMNAILVTWRKAWWQKGFKPVILSPAEAINNPLYAELQTKGLEAPVEMDISKWLAWGSMGTGVFCHYLTLPMGAYEDPLLASLRRGAYPQLTRYDNLGSGIFSGTQVDITAAIKQALENPDLKNAQDFISAVPADTFKIDAKPDSIAYYNDATVKDKYPKIADEIIGAGASGYQILNKLINSHLHGTWQNLFSNGIAVVKPKPDHMSTIIEPALRLAKFLSVCPESPAPASCPPNLPRCKPCVASTPMKISTPPAYRNTSGLYTIGTVPHPYTMAVMGSLRDDIDIRWIRRDSPRDPWLSTLTKELLGTGVSGAPRVIKFKGAVASPHGTSHSLWITAERDIPVDLDWYFGFSIPRSVTDTGKSETPVPGPERRPQPEHDPKDGPVPNSEDLVKEGELLKRAKEFGKTRSPEQDKIRGAIEAWNLADTEAWRFARAFLARHRLERLKWEEEEKNYAGGVGAEREKGKGRWFDD